MFTLINPIALLFTLITAFGVLVHDTKFDRAAVVYVAPAVLATYAAVDSAVKSGDSHTHVERVHGPNGYASTIRASLPRVQPRDDERHIQSKKIYYSGGNAALYLAVYLS